LLQGQVSYYLTASRRKVHALVEAMDETEIEHAEIVTSREEKTVRTDAGTIRVVPAWRWMLEGR
jgi:predicted AAA+ superfamily ATPase